MVKLHHTTPSNDPIHATINHGGETFQVTATSLDVKFPPPRVLQGLPQTVELTITTRDISRIIFRDGTSWNLVSEPEADDDGLDI